MDLGIISPVMMKLFLSCPFKFYLKYIEGVSAPALDKNFITGKKIHALASYYLQKIDISDFLNSLSEKESAYFNNLINCKYFNYEMVATEKNISLKLGQFWIGGRIDAIVKDDGNYYILDYKTGGVSDDMTYDAQTMVYMLACREFYKQFESLSFVYIDLKNNKEVVIPLTSDLKKEYETKILEICDNITNFSRQKFKKRPDCSCEYQKICVNY